MPGGGHVRNGAGWTVTAVHSDGSIDATQREDRGRAIGQSPPAMVRLPAHYVAEHVELGYASTVHRAQGVTVDTSHPLVGPGMDRQSLCVAMTRGREANHAYVPLDAPTEDHLTRPHVTGRQILDHALATDGRDHSATVTMGRRQDAAFSQQRLASIRETLPAAQLPEVAADVDRLIALRRTNPRARHSATRPSPGKGQDPIGR